MGLGLVRDISVGLHSEDEMVELGWGSCLEHSCWQGLGLVKYTLVGLHSESG